MVLTRLSHVGEVCPLSDHSYSDPIFSSNHEPQAPSHHVVSVSKSNAEPSSVSKSNAEPSSVEGGESSNVVTRHILEFSNEVLEKIFLFLTYKEIGELRRVCKRFDKIGSNILSMAFQRLQNQMMSRFQATKSLMPRRESARRKHPLARESDILETVCMRLTLLQMTFGKHIERKHCCFFAGDILDEVYRIMRCVKSIPIVGKVCKITDELFDLSTMAMEYFKEHIEPGLPELSYFGSDFLDITGFSESGSSRCSIGDGRVSEPEDDILERDPLPPSNMVLRKRIRKIRQGMRRYNNQLAVMRREIKVCKNRVVDQNKQLLEYYARMEDCDKKMDDTTRKLSTVLQELNKCKTELQYCRSRSPVHPICMYCNCGRFASGESSGAPDAFWTARDAEERVMGPPQPRAFVPPSYYPSSLPSPSFSPSPSSTVKNLEPLFDLEKSTPFVFPDTQTSKQALLPSASSSSSSSSSSLPFSGEDLGDQSESTMKRSSSDEDADIGTDTVGKRVRERKRIRLEPH